MIRLLSNDEHISSVGCESSLDLEQLSYIHEHLIDDELHSKCQCSLRYTFTMFIPHVLRQNVSDELIIERTSIALCVLSVSTLSTQFWH